MKLPSRCPRYLLNTSTESGDGLRPAIFVEGARGEELAQLLPQLPAADRSPVLVHLGRVLRMLHSVQTPGVWRPDRGGRWPDPQELRRTFIAKRLAERPHLVAAGLSAGEVDHTTAPLGASPLAGFVPCHGDATPDHIFIDAELRISGLID